MNRVFVDMDGVISTPTRPLRNDMKVKIVPAVILYCVLATTVAWAISWVAVFKFGFIHSNWLGGQPHDQNASLLLLMIWVSTGAVTMPHLLSLIFSEPKR